MNRLTYEIPRPKKPLLLPKVLGEDAVVRLLAAAENTKHKLLLSLCYGMGLRVSEVCALKIVDIDSDRMQVNIVAAKGKKDRYVNLPTLYWKIYEIIIRITYHQFFYLKASLVIAKVLEVRNRYLKIVCKKRK